MVSSVSVLLFLIVWLFHDISVDATKVTKPLAPTSKEGVWRSVHRLSVMQLMHFHHLLGSAWVVLTDQL